MKILLDNSRQSIFDVALREFGSVAAAFEMSSQFDISITSDLPQELEVSAIESDDVVVAYYHNNNFNPATKFHESDIVVNSDNVDDSANAVTLIISTQKRTITPLDRQTLFDVALQNFGSVEAVFDLAETNNVSITVMPQELDIPATASRNKRVLSYYTNRTIKPATGISSTIGDDGDDTNIEQRAEYVAIRFINNNYFETITYYV